MINSFAPGSAWKRLALRRLFRDVKPSVAWTIFLYPVHVNIRVESSYAKPWRRLSANERARKGRLSDDGIRAAIAKYQKIPDIETLQFGAQFGGIPLHETITASDDGERRVFQSVARSLAVCSCYDLRV